MIFSRLAREPTHINGCGLLPKKKMLDTPALGLLKTFVPNNV